LIKIREGLVVQKALFLSPIGILIEVYLPSMPMMMKEVLLSQHQ
jgi:hypothetical protein